MERARAEVSGTGRGLLWGPGWVLLGAAVGPSDPDGMGPCVPLSFPRRLRVMLPLLGSPGDFKVSASFTRLLWKSNGAIVLTSCELLQNAPTQGLEGDENLNFSEEFRPFRRQECCLRPWILRRAALCSGSNLGTLGLFCVKAREDAGRQQ